VAQKIPDFSHIYLHELNAALLEIKLLSDCVVREKDPIQVELFIDPMMVMGWLKNMTADIPLPKSKIMFFVSVRTSEKDIYAVYMTLCKSKAFLIFKHHLTVLIMSESRTTVEKLQKVKQIDNNSAKSRRFCGWSEVFTYIPSFEIQSRD
jgi:hypothetical protein